MAQIGAKNRIINRITLFLLGAAMGGLALYVLQPQSQAFPPLIGRASVIDGDTLEIAGQRIRMQGIDAPESAQTCDDETGKPWLCGQQAALELDAMVAARPVTCEIDPRDPQDRYGRTLGWCRVAGTALSTRMVREGFAVAYRQYLDYKDHTPRPYKSELIAAEDEAKSARRGLWRITVAQALFNSGPEAPPFFSSQSVWACFRISRSTPGWPLTDFHEVAFYAFQLAGHLLLNNQKAGDGVMIRIGVDGCALEHVEARFMAV